MRKRERENPCGICGHYHRYEEGEVCGVCGHRLVVSAEQQAASPVKHESAFPSEILKDFLYLGSYDNASRSELLKTIGVSHILNTVPDCQNLYRNSFTYHCLQDETLQFDNAIPFLEECEREKARVLVHCMSGKSRSAAVVIAFLMKSKRWRLAQCFQWVKERRPQISITDAVQQQLVEYEQKLFGPSVGSTTPQAFAASGTFPPLGFGFPKPPTEVPAPVFNQQPAASIFERAGPNGFPGDFTFGAGRSTEMKLPEGGSAFGVTSTGNDTVMDSS